MTTENFSALQREYLALRQFIQDFPEKANGKTERLNYLHGLIKENNPSLLEKQEETNNNNNNIFFIEDEAVSSVSIETRKLGNSGNRKTSWTADELMVTEFPQPPMIVDGLITVGLNSLAGRPKIGKSYLALQIAGAAGTGTQVLGRKVEQVPVLYLALEDNPARLKKRMQEQKWPKGANVRFELEWPLLNEGGLERLDSEIKDCGFKLVIIDTISRAMRFKPSDADDSTMSGLQHIAFDYDAAIVVIDHHKKPGMGSAQDVIDDVLGFTVTKTAVPDNIIGLYRAQGEKRAELKAVGRDQEFIDLTLEMAYDVMTWQLIGETQAVVSNLRHEAILEALAELGNDATHGNIHKLTDILKGTLSKDLAELIDNRIIEKVGEGIGAYYRQKENTILF